MNQRIFVEKKSAFDVESQKVLAELQEFTSLTHLKQYVIYDVFDAKEENWDKLLTVLLDAVADIPHTENPATSSSSSFAMEYLPGQYDQRADSAEQAIQLVVGNRPAIRTGKLFVFDQVDNDTLDKIKDYLINNVDSHEKNLDVLVNPPIPKPTEVPVVEGFINMDEDALVALHREWSFSFDLADLKFIQTYFQKENRNPTETELKVLDTYWSDHCRHTTFFTELTDIKFAGDLAQKLESIFERYLAIRKELNREHKPISLMDIGTIAAKYLRANGKLDDLVITDEINACTIEIEVDVEGEKQEWYLLFKNETHNHPTEIEPFGGASTCVGGAIRDPLSGRAFVYQAMRVTGSADPRERIEDTLEGKLPQKKITKTAAKGYASYGNQIGLATSQIAEVYDQGYKAKRMEVGYVAGAVPKDWVRREAPLPGDRVIMVGGKTGRDGVGGASGSSKVQDETSINSLSAEVQKGDAVEERKIQRLFRKPEVTRLIKKCNDFGAGGVSVAIGEIADSLNINLDKLPTKYAGLNGTELAISESQERMAVVVEAKDVEDFVAHASQENLLAVEVAEVTDSGRMQIFWRGEKIVDLDREFLDTAGTEKSMHAEAVSNGYAETQVISPLTNESFKNELSKLNVASQKGLIENFDSHVGRTTVLMPLGGKYLKTPALASVNTIPVLNKSTDTVAISTWGFSTDLANKNPFLMGGYAVVESLAKLVASGGNHKDARLSFQEYFERLGGDAEKWGKPLQALLGALEAQLEFETAAIGGKDSMSGTFENIHVPPTLISFACAVGELKNIISPEIKGEGNFLYLAEHNADASGVPNYDQLNRNYSDIHSHIQNGTIISAQTIKDGGLATAVFKMAVGNGIGADINYGKDCFKPQIGSLILESSTELKDFDLLGKTGGDSLTINGENFDINELTAAWETTLEPIFPSATPSIPNNNSVSTQNASNELQKPSVGAIPRVFIPIFPGTNCEYETEHVFVETGADVHTRLFTNYNETAIQESIEAFVEQINAANIVMIPGGFSAGDEPDGSAKYIVSVLKNPQIKEAVHALLKRGGLMLGICNGFQALVKSGLLPYGEIRDLDESSATMTFNSIGRHISQTAQVEVKSDKSPWLAGMQGKKYIVPFSHGEGRFYATDAMVKELAANGQIATQYVDFEGNVALDMPFNPNGSVHGIEGITDKSGQIYGRMGHPERYRKGLMKNIPEMEFMDIFKNGVEWFK
ncbi:MAG: phosphoribosylformylglycinamidine synthase [Bacteroidia bacterium]